MGSREDPEGRLEVFVKEIRHNPIYQTVWLLKIGLAVLALNLIVLLAYKVGLIG